MLQHPITREFSAYQATISHPVSTTGVGLHSGLPVKVTLKPAPVNTGIVFRRLDLPGTPELKVSYEMVKETRLCTGIQNADNSIQLRTIEHLMSALAATCIDNLYVELDAAEVPIMDGSAIEWVKLIDQAIPCLQKEAFKSYYIIKRELVTTLDDKFIKLTPTDVEKHPFLIMAFEIDFNHPAIDKQVDNFEIHSTPEAYVEHVADCRTFGFLKDIDYLRSLGLCKGGSLDNAIVLDDEKVLNPEGLRHRTELVRHKILDSIGDLFLAGHRIVGRFAAYKAGHQLNNMALHNLFSDPDNYELVSGERYL